MTVEVKRRGMVRAITDLPETTDPLTGYLEIEKASAFYKVSQALIGGADPALQPLGTEVAAYSSELGTLPATWDWLNQGTSTVDVALRRAVITPQLGGAGVNDLRLWGPPTWPAAPFTARTRLINYGTLANVAGGFAVYRPSNGRIHTVHIYVRVSLSAGQVFSEVWAVFDWSSFTAVNATRYGPTNQDYRSRDRYLQVRCDGTSIFFDYSPDNARFINISSTTLAAYLGGTGSDLRVMLLANNPTATAGEQVGYNWLRTYSNSNLNQ